MTDTITVRRATIDDLDDLAAIDRAGFEEREQWSRQAWADELAAADRVVLVARDTEGLAGAISIARQFDTVDLLRVVVAQRSRRRRLGERLVHEAVWHVRDADRVLLEVRHDNAAALMLYARLGFRAIDRRPDYYGPGLHAVVMQSDLPWEALS
ncbi:GNAT family N-acetyltransferase [Aestuariimicrobium ganziense]|uniref:GNAT family N-acetyltransferase n=1 Tax=Aestuariimicrobium ganziense TaxID=2773677 RepID=UPI001940AD16|nr:GNAT family N-acetyltransferase [Aestuariimicrobium ganziense]